VGGLAAVGLGAAATPADAGPTFYGEVLPLLQDHCQECHREAGANYGGMRAPMAFTSYESTRPWARSIAKQVASHEMPPWDAAPEHHGVFRNERTLNEAQIGILVQWAQAGAPAGDPSTAPPPRTFQVTDGWLIGEPGLVVTMPEPYLVEDDVNDLYAAFSVELTEEMLPEDRWVVAFQCKPDSDVIHHFNLHLLEPDENGELPPPPDFPDQRMIAPSPKNAGRYVGGVSSGSEANAYPEGYGFLLKKGSRVTFDIHYHKEAGPGTAVWDQSSIGFKFTDKPITKALGSGFSPLMNFTFAIPPGDANHQIGPLTTAPSEHPVDIIALMPHMHMRGKAARFVAIYPDGSRETLLDVPRYDFEWQTVYYYDQLKQVPAGTRIEYTAWFDNSPEKAAIYGFDPTRTVRFGQPSTDEMVMGFVMSARADGDPPGADPQPGKPQD
jgi:mono/diheme cytochrome c family protein